MNKELAAKGLKPVQDQSINPFAKRVRKMRFDGMGLEPIPEQSKAKFKVNKPAKPVAAKKSARPSAAGSAALRKANPDAGRKKPVVKKAAPKKKSATKKVTRSHKDTKSYNVRISVVSGTKRKSWCFANRL